MILAADFETLWHEYHSRILNFIGDKVRDPEATQDLRSIVYLRALVATHNGNGYKTNAEAWLFRIARTVIIDYWRQRKRTGWLVELDDMPWDSSYDGDQDMGKRADYLIDDAPEPYEATVRQLEHEVVRWAVGRLTNEQERVLTMRLDGYDMEEVAAHVGKEFHATKALDYRARQSIAPLVRAKWGEAA